MGKFGDFLNSGSGGAAIGAGGGVLGSIASGIFQKKAQKRQFEYNEKAADSAHKRGLQTMGIMDYMNSPERMKQRMREAGLNPALMYGNGASGASGSASAASGPQGAGASMAQSPDFAGVGAQMGIMMQNARLIEAQTKKTDAEADAISGYQKKESETRSKLNEIMGVTEGIKQKGEELDNGFKTIELEIKGLTKGAEVKKIWGDVREQKARTEKMLADIDATETNTDIIKQSKMAIVSEYNAKAMKTWAEVNAVNAGTDVSRMELQTMAASIYKVYQEVAIAKDHVDISEKDLKEKIRSNLVREGFDRHVVAQGYIDQGLDLFKAFIPWGSGKEAARPVRGFGK